MNDNRKRDIFYGVVAVATLIVALVGATLAYFTLTTSSSEGAVGAQAGVVSIDYEDGKQVSIQATELIPSSFDVVKKSYETYVKDSSEIDMDDLDSESPKCIDSNNRQVCSTYRFSIGNESGQPLIAKLNAEFNGFTTESLSFGVYDLINKQWVALEKDSSGSKYYLTFTQTCDNEDDSTENDCYTQTGETKTYKEYATKSIYGYTIDSGISTINTNNTGTQQFELVLFINETNENQNADQGKSFRGTITVELAEGSDQVTGYIK